MSALQATDRFDIFSTAATTVGAPPEVPGDHIPAGDGHSNEGMSKATPDPASVSTSEIRKGTTAVIHAEITEVLDGHARESRGHYNFMQLPVANDKIVITNRRGAYDVMRVLSSAHAPETTVYVQWLTTQRL